MRNVRLGSRLGRRIAYNDRFVRLLANDAKALGWPPASIRAHALLSCRRTEESCAQRMPSENASMTKRKVRWHGTQIEPAGCALAGEVNHGDHLHRSRRLRARLVAGTGGSGPGYRLVPEEIVKASRVAEPMIDVRGHSANRS